MKLRPSKRNYMSWFTRWVSDKRTCDWAGSLSISFGRREAPVQNFTTSLRLLGIFQMVTVSDAHQRINNFICIVAYIQFCLLTPGHWIEKRKEICPLSDVHIQKKNKIKEKKNNFNQETTIHSSWIQAFTE